jgi:hypothetical protein
MRALVRKWWQPAAAVEAKAVTKEDVTGGDAPDDAEESSQSRRNTVCTYAYIHTHSVCTLASAHCVS